MLLNSYKPLAIGYRELELCFEICYCQWLNGVAR